MTGRSHPLTKPPKAAVRGRRGRGEVAGAQTGEEHPGGGRGRPRSCHEDQREADDEV